MRMARFRSLLLSFRLKIIFLFVSILFVLPQVSVKYPGLLDDGGDLLTVGNNSFSRIFAEDFIFGQRTWPLRMIFKKILVIFFEYEVGYHYLVYAVILSALLWLFYRNLLKLTKSKSISLSFSFLLLLSPGIVGNFYRLGTVEHYQTIFFLLTLLFLKRKPILSLSFLVVNLFVKETTFIYGFVLIWFFSVVKPSRKYFISTSLILFVYGVFIFSKRFFVSDLSYVEQFAFSIDNILVMANEAPVTLIYLLLSISAFIILLASKFKIARETYDYLFYSLIFLSIFFFWKMGSYYYHLPIQAMLLLFSAQLLNQFRLIESLKHFYHLFILIFFLAAIFIANSSLKTAVRVHKISLEDSALVSFILNGDWNNYKIYTDVESFEGVIWIESYFNNWGKFKNIDFNPSSESLNKVGLSDQSGISELLQNAKQQYASDSSNNKIFISTQNQLPNGVPLPESAKLLCNSSFLVKNHCSFYVLGL